MLGSTALFGSGVFASRAASAALYAETFTDDEDICPKRPPPDFSGGCRMLNRVASASSAQLVGGDGAYYRDHQSGRVHLPNPPTPPTLGVEPRLQARAPHWVWAWRRRCNWDY